MKRFPLLLILLLLLPAGWGWRLSASTITEKDVEAALDNLDRAMSRRAEFKERRLQSIDSLRHIQSRTEKGSIPWFDTTMDIARRFTGFYIDSALYYYSQGYDMASKMKLDSIADEFRALRATYLSIGGYIHDAMTEMEAIDTVGFSPARKLHYLTANRQMCSYISNYYDPLSDTHDYWSKRATEAQRELIPLLEPGSVAHQLNLGEYLYQKGEYSRSLEILTRLINTEGIDNHSYAIACNILASICRTKGDTDGYVYYLALSALADVRNATLEVTSIQQLGGVLFEKGDSRRAHDYLRAAMDNAIDSKASVRLVTTSELFAIIENEHIAQISRWRSFMYVVILLLTVVLIALAVLTFFLRKQLRRIDSMKIGLEESNRAKDVYIGQFLTLCSIYMDKLKQFTKLVNRKISAGQVDELFKLAKSGKFIEEQSRDFYMVFDDAFLHIYPDFVREVNKLLLPDQQIVLNEGEQMNTDLRILAFMRLGITDTTRVAQILNYTVNTIYAYRNKLRNRARNRDTFEQDIMAIVAR